MKRFAFFLGILAVIGLAGCGSDSPAPINPGEVQKNEQRRQEEREPGATPAAPAAGTSATPDSRAR